MRGIALLRLLCGAALLGAAVLMNAGDAGATHSAGGAKAPAVIRESAWDPGGRAGFTIYDPTTGLWRQLPSGPQNQRTAILPAEIRDGVVRVRTESDELANALRAVALSTTSP